MKKLPRRDVLKLGAAAVGACALPVGCAPRTDPIVLTDGVDPADYDGGVEVEDTFTPAPQDDETFDLGVQAGAVRPNSARLWAHVTGYDAALSVAVWRPGVEDPDLVVVGFEGDASPNDGGYALLNVTGLAPATEYFYAFFKEDGSRSGLGRIKTAFPPGFLAPLTVGAMTCTNERNAPWRACEKIAAERPDLLLHVGDMSYNDGAFTLEEYRQKWALALSDPGYRAVLPTAGMYNAWDDHEFTNDLNPETVDPDLLRNATQAFYESLPQEPGPEGKLWKSYRWGATVEFFVLDCRTERKPSTRDSEDAVYIGEEQMAWLKGALSESPCHFKVLLNSVPATGFTSDFWALRGDRWQGYQAQRQELLDFITDSAIENVWFIAGDFHLGFVTRLEADGPARNMWEIACGPTGNLGNPLALLVDDPEVGPDVFPPSMFRYARGAIAATMLTFDPLRNTVRVRFIDAEDDEVLFDEYLQWGV